MPVNDIIFKLLQEALWGTPFEQLTDSGDNDTSLWSEVYSELEKQAVLGLTAPVANKHNEIPESLRLSWSGLQRTFAIRYVQMAVAQDKACKLLQEAGIKVAVMKGMAAAIYYPVPEYRAMGDVDLLVSPEDYEKTLDILRMNDYIELEEEEERYHTPFVKHNVLFEVHRSPAGIHRSEKGDIIAEYILSGLDSIENNTIGQDQFPIMPWKQNGMELIWHIRQHLYNGLGLRHIIDWMMFVNYTLDDDRMREYMPDLRKCGLDQLAIVVTKTCQKYLGLSHEKITWCDVADETLCDNLMSFIMGQGNFGIKAMDEKTAKVVSGYSSLDMLLSKLQAVGEKEWALLRRYPFLKPFAFVYGGVSAVNGIRAQEGGLKRAMEDFRTGQSRKRLFSRLYGKKRIGEDVFGKILDTKRNLLNKFNRGNRKARKTGKTDIEERKNKIKRIIDKINGSRLSVVFKSVTEYAALVEYYIYDFVCLCSGYRMPSKEERELVRENVTFLYKSFERQKMAKQLYRSIQRFYPGAQVVIADDSKQPLKMSGKAVTIINLPFNSGLSYGLNQALKQVKTPYVIRLDDDHLLTRRTHVGEQIAFLKRHPEVDLVGFGLINALRPERPEDHIRKFYPQSMDYAPKALKIPHLTRIDDTHLVLGKGLNLFIIETDKLKAIGYDDSIRMMEHDDFFYRAAGNIVSVVAEDTRVFHRHNMFDTGYMKYRSDVEGDAAYIHSVRRFFRR